ncbi:MAG: hypothetical protein RSC84_01810 [Peptostreptococcaceae bacterium]
MSKLRKTRVINRTDMDKSKLCCFGYVDYIVLASTLSIAISEEVNSNDLSILATFFAVLSDELALIGSVKNCTNNSNNADNSFVAPVPDTAITRSKPKIKKIKKIKKKYKKI